jgi:hypothetical protein
VVPDWWIGQATTQQIDNGTGGYGYFWWIGQRQLPGQRHLRPVDHHLPRRAAGDRHQLRLAGATGRELSAARTAMIDAVREAAKGL